MAPKAEPKKRARAPRGQAVCPAKISGMLTMLRYQVNSGKDQEKATAADQALKVYEELTQPNDREKFLAEFEANGGGKAHGSLRFALTFRQRVSDSFSTEVSATENYLTRPS